MKTLNTVMREKFIEYLTNINVKTDKSMKLSELIVLIKKCNDGAPQMAVGTLTDLAVKEYENQSHMTKS